MPTAKTKSVTYYGETGQLRHADAALVHGEKYTLPVDVIEAYAPLFKKPKAAKKTETPKPEAGKEG